MRETVRWCRWWWLHANDLLIFTKMLYCWRILWQNGSTLVKLVPCSNARYVVILCVIRWRRFCETPWMKTSSQVSCRNNPDYKRRSSVAGDEVCSSKNAKKSFSSVMKSHFSISEVSGTTVVTHSWCGVHAPSTERFLFKRLPQEQASPNAYGSWETSLAVASLRGLWWCSHVHVFFTHISPF